MLNRSDRPSCAPVLITSQLGVVVSWADLHSSVSAATVVGGEHFFNRRTVYTLVGRLGLEQAQDGGMYIPFHTILRLLLPAVATPLLRVFLERQKSYAHARHCAASIRRQPA